jgi:hypothetical protein
MFAVPPATARPHELADPLRVVARTAELSLARLVQTVVAEYVERELRDFLADVRRRELVHELHAAGVLRLRGLRELAVARVLVRAHVALELHESLPDRPVLDRGLAVANGALRE